jgi:hypothetical protein
VRNRTQDGQLTVQQAVEGTRRHDLRVRTARPPGHRGHLEGTDTADRHHAAVQPDARGSPTRVVNTLQAVHWSPARPCRRKRLPRSSANALGSAARERRRKRSSTAFLVPLEADDDRASCGCGCREGCGVCRRAPHLIRGTRRAQEKPRLLRGPVEAHQNLSSTLHPGDTPPQTDPRLQLYVRLAADVSL